MALHGKDGIQYSVLSLQLLRSLLILVMRVCSTSGRFMTLSWYSVSGISFSFALLLRPIFPSFVRKFPPPFVAFETTFLLPDMKPPPSLFSFSFFFGTEGRSGACSSLSPFCIRSADLPRLSFFFAAARYMLPPVHSALMGAVFGGCSKVALKSGLVFEWESRRIDFDRTSGLRKGLSLRFDELTESSLWCGEGCGRPSVCVVCVLLLLATRTCQLLVLPCYNNNRQAACGVSRRVAKLRAVQKPQGLRPHVSARQ
jgi:hypothetical protein